jgi:hypothetical protein
MRMELAARLRTILTSVATALGREIEGGEAWEQVTQCGHDGVLHSSLTPAGVTYCRLRRS